MRRAVLRWWGRRSLRARLVLLGSAGLAVGLAAGAVLLVGALRYTLERAQDRAALETARDVAALVDADRLPDPVPVGGTTVVQVIDAAGRVRAASAGADRLVPVFGRDDLDRLRRGDRLYRPGEPIGVDGEVRVVAVRAGPAADPQLVVVAAPVGERAGSVGFVRTALGVGFALLLLVLAALAWRVVGWTLRPVEALRAGAEEITGTGSAGQLPVPGSRDEIHRLAVTLNDMLARLEAARRRQRAFVADAAHELRSPLASMRTQLEVAEATGTGLDTADLLAEIERLSRLVDDLLLLARTDDGGGTATGRREPVDLAAVATACVAARVAVPDTGRPSSEASPSAPRPDLTLAVRASSAVVHGEPDALRRVVENLVDNAVRYATARITVATGTDGTDAVLTVRDDGPGIPAADRERVFGRFTRLDDDRGRGTGGAGLGLAIVAELVRAHGGAVTLADADPAATPPGLAVTVRLPAGG